MNPDAVQVRVDALPACYQTLLESLTLAELNAAELNEAFANYVTAECLQCGIQVAGEELGRIALAGAEGSGGDPRLSRLRKGYCAREGCESYYYRLILREHPKVDWSKLAQSLAQTAAAPSVSVPLPKRSSGISLLLADKRARRVLAGIGVLLLLLVVRHFATGGRIPFTHKAPAYTVDPASVSPSVQTNR